MGLFVRVGVSVCVCVCAEGVGVICVCVVLHQCVYVHVSMWCVSPQFAMPLVLAVLQ